MIESLKRWLPDWLLLVVMGKALGTFLFLT